MFIRENIIEEVVQWKGNNNAKRKFFILSGEYRDNPNKYLELEEEINLDLSKLYADYEQKFSR